MGLSRDRARRDRSLPAAPVLAVGGLFPQRQCGRSGEGSAGGSYLPRRLCHAWVLRPVLLLAAALQPASPDSRAKSWGF